VNVSASTGGQHPTVKTCPAAMGFAFAAGTTDGPGAFDFKQGDVKVGSTANQTLASQISLACYDGFFFNPSLGKPVLEVSTKCT